MKLHDRIAALERAGVKCGELAELLERQGVGAEELEKIVRDAIAECELAGDAQGAAELRAIV